jgi:ribosomal protein L5
VPGSNFAIKETSLDHILEFWGAIFKTTFNIWWLQLLVLWFSLAESVQYTNRSQVPRVSKIIITCCVILSSRKSLQPINADDEHNLLFK